MTTTFSIEIFNKRGDGKTGCLINEYDVSPLILTETTADLLAQVQVTDLIDGVDIQIKEL